MPVPTISPGRSVTSILHHDGGSNFSTRSFTIPRIKTVATFLRHGYRSPSTHVTESRHHNRLIIACTLPGEVMRKIFTACAQFSIGGGVESWSWVNISYVCSTWRRVALKTPDLWRYIDFSHPKWYAITSVRAKMSPLHVVTTVADHNIRQLHRTLQLAHRIQHIHLVSPIQKIIPLLEILAYPNPSLESLILDIRTPPSDDHQENTYDAPSFPCTGPPLENLKYMELHGSPFYLLTPRCIFLTNLHLHDLPLSERPLLRYFLSTLEQLTHLQMLTLDGAFPIDIDGENHQAPVTPISLLQLKCLSLVGSISEIANTLKYLTIPPPARLIGRICTLSDVKRSAQKLTENLSARSWGESNLETLVLTGRETGQRYLEGLTANPEFRQSVRVRAFGGGDVQSGAQLDLIIDPAAPDSSDDSVITALDAICAALPLGRIHTLALQDVDIITQKSWTPILRSLPSLRVLDIIGRAPSGLVWALLLNAHSGGQKRGKSREAQQIFVPQLNDIYLHNVDCSSGGFMVASNSPINSHCDLDDSRFLDVLVAGILHRRRAGIFLRSLCIARCEYVLKKTAEAARAVVLHLISDFRGRLIKDEDIDETFPARYRAEWDLKRPHIRHYHRLRTLTQLDADS